MGSDGRRVVVHSNGRKQTRAGRCPKPMRSFVGKVNVPAMIPFTIVLILLTVLVATEDAASQSGKDDNGE